MRKIWRVFISSTFEDFRFERAVLQKFIFPEIKKAANEKGISFLPIDLRWGVPEESQIDQRTMDICLSEVERATTEPHPDFLILSGDKYGWVPLPRVIEKKEFEDILEKLKKFRRIRNLLNTWYELDYNQLPPSYILKSRDEVTDKDYTKWDNWEKVENRIRKIFQLAVKELNFDKDKKEKYCISATHQELKTFLKHENSDKELKNHLIGFIRKFNDLDRVEEKIKSKLSDKQDDNIKKLREEIKNNILKDNLKILDVTAKFYEKAFEENEKCLAEKKDNEKKECFIENIFENINSLEEIEKKLEDKDFAKYLIEFGNFVKERLLESLENIKVENFTEKDYQEDYKNYLLSRPFVGREEEIKNILDEIEKNDKVLIYGESGIGKSAIMAQVIKRLEEKNKDVVYRFCGVTDNSLFIEDILYSICKEIKGDVKKLDEIIKKIEDSENKKRNKEKQLEQIENSKKQKELKKEIQKIDEKLKKSKKNFFDYIKDNLSNSNKIFLIDAIDQLKTKYEDNLDWLDFGGKILLSVLKDRRYKEYYSYQKVDQKFDKNIEIKRLYNPKLILEELLKKENRTLTEKQFNYVFEKKDSNKPLYLTIAKEEVKFWRSSDDFTNHKKEENKKNRYLSETQEEIIEEFFENLISMHFVPGSIVRNFILYAFGSNQRLREDEVINLLASNKYVIDEISNEYHKNLTNDLPPAVWSRFRWMIKDYLKEDENGYIKFFHREFNSLKNKCKFYNQSEIDYGNKKVINYKKKRTDFDYLKKVYSCLFNKEKYKIKPKEIENNLEKIIDEYGVTEIDERIFNSILDRCNEKGCECDGEEDNICNFINDLRNELLKIVKENNLGIADLMLRIVIPLKKSIEKYNESYYANTRLRFNNIDIEKILGLDKEFEVYKLIYETDGIYHNSFEREEIVSNIQFVLENKIYERIYDFFENSEDIGKIIRKTIEDIRKFRNYLETDVVFNIINCTHMGRMNYSKLINNLKVLYDYPDETKKVFSDEKIFNELKNMIKNIGLLKELFYITDFYDYEDLHKNLSRLVILNLIELKDYESLKQELIELSNIDCLDDDIIKILLLCFFSEKKDEILCLIDPDYCEYLIEQNSMYLEPEMHIIKENVTARELKTIIREEYYKKLIVNFLEEQEKIILKAKDEEILGDLVTDGESLYLNIK